VNKRDVREERDLREMLLQKTESERARLAFRARAAQQESTPQDAQKAVQQGRSE
jgi:hypothetical protein